MFRLKLLQKKRHVLHMDADAFFASVEQVLNPTLRGKAILVGDVSGTKGIVSAASYESRACGVYSGMPMYQAVRKCPKAIIVPGHFEAYRDFSSKMYQIMLDFTPEVEMASIDEAYMDLTGCELMHKLPPQEIARKILYTINRKLGLSVSGGLASSKTVSKVASSTNKPHKLTIVPYGKEAGFLAPLKLKCMPGVGRKTLPLLEAHGFQTIGDISKLTMEEVKEKFGLHGIALWKRCLGIDNSPVVSTYSLPKSISKEHTFYESTYSKDVCLKQMKELSEMVFKKLRMHKMKARTVFIKIRYKSNEKKEASASYYSLFKEFSWQKNLDIPACTDSKLFPLIKELFLSNFSNQDPIRLIGIGVSNLIQNYNLSLFQGNNEEEKLFTKIDMIKEVYGDEALRYGV
ncbi:MAG: DNA polymerase IV [Patescibacteria group bacterium]